MLIYMNIGIPMVIVRLSIKYDLSGKLECRWIRGKSITGICHSFEIQYESGYEMFGVVLNDAWYLSIKFSAVANILFLVGLVIHRMSFSGADEGMHFSMGDDGNLPIYSGFYPVPGARKSAGVMVG